jgi:hypothetical protein
MGEAVIVCRSCQAGRRAGDRPRRHPARPRAGPAPAAAHDRLAAHPAAAESVRSRELLVELAAVFVRVVRSTDVNYERIEGLLSRIEESDGPPPGVPSAGPESCMMETTERR